MIPVINARYRAAQPTVSIIVPFYHDDPRPLLGALCAQADSVGAAVELLIYDDGTADVAMTAILDVMVQQCPLPAALFTAPQNLGRAKGRNAMVHHARGDWVLFIDSDMQPDDAHYLSRWLAYTRAPTHDIAFGGYTHLHTQVTPDTALHHFMADRTECVPASTRNQNPARYMSTANLMVRRSVMLAQPFDESFSGWGGEDVEWALRVLPDHPLVHVDISASHLGLDAPEVLLNKFRQSVPNYARMLASHPAEMTRFQSYKAARVLRWLGPVRPLVIAACGAVVRLRCRALLLVQTYAIKVYRATLYSDVVSP